MRIGESGDRHAGVVNLHDPFVGLETGVEQLRGVTCVTATAGVHRRCQTVRVEAGVGVLEFLRARC
jgi:hypothetical protein